MLLSKISLAGPGLSVSWRILPGFKLPEVSRLVFLYVIDKISDSYIALKNNKYWNSYLIKGYQQSQDTKMRRKVVYFKFIFSAFKSEFRNYLSCCPDEFHPFFYKNWLIEIHCWIWKVPVPLQPHCAPCIL